MVLGLAMENRGLRNFNSSCNNFQAAQNCSDQCDDKLLDCIDNCMDLITDPEPSDLSECAHECSRTEYDCIDRKFFEHSILSDKNDEIENKNIKN